MEDLISTTLGYFKELSVFDYQFGVQFKTVTVPIPMSKCQPPDMKISNDIYEIDILPT